MQKGQRIKIIKSNIKFTSNNSNRNNNSHSRSVAQSLLASAALRCALDLTQLNYLTANFVKCN